MLKRLTIQNYALIDAVNITFPDGLIIITGETGAGKSILLGALSLLLGNKADSSVFKDESKNCVVEAEFGDESILRRVVSPNGRSRSFLNDEPISLSQLAEISKRIIDIHAQHQHLLLSDPDFQLSVLDFYAGNGPLLEQYGKCHEAYKDAIREVEILENKITTIKADAQYRQFQFNQLEQAKLRVGELAELEQEQKRLSNAEEIKNSLSEVSKLLNPYDISLVQSLKEAANLLSKSSKYVDSLNELSQRIQQTKVELSDIESEVDSIAEGIVIDPERLRSIEDRMSLIYSLLKKHCCSNEEELLLIQNSLDNSLVEGELLEEKLEQSKLKAASLQTERAAFASKLSVKRKESAPSLSSELQKSIRELEMPKAEFRVELTPKENFSSTGGDTLHFLFSANGSNRIGDISKVASGGELSRVMLALKSLVAQYTSLPTMIFDEIDVGVSGKIADKMGDLIGRMGTNMQIFAITHLPQVASKKGTHFLVYKEFDTQGIAHTGIKRLSPDERVMELARMLSGSSLSEAAIANAKVLLAENENKLI